MHNEARVREDIRNLTSRFGDAGFPYLEIRASERARSAASRWPLLVSTNRALGLSAHEPVPTPSALMRGSDLHFAAPAPADARIRELEDALPILTSTRRFADAQRLA